MGELPINTTHHASRTTQYVIIVVLLLLAFALRIWNLAAQSVWWDEAFTVQTASHGWANLWHMLQTGDRNPPLYFLSLFLWSGVAGWSEFSLRFLSVVYGVIGVMLVYKSTARLFGSRAGACALAVTAFAPALVVYSQEGRMYALFFALAAGTIYCGLRIAHAGTSIRQYALRSRQYSGLLLFESALLLTHYFAVPLVVALNLFLLIDLIRHTADRRAWLKWIVGQAIACLPILIWTAIIFSTPGSLIKASELRPDWLYFAWQSIVLWMTGVRDTSLQMGSIFAISIGMIGITAIAAWFADRRARFVIAFGLTSFLLAFGLASLLTSFHPRYVLVFSIPMFILIGSVISSATRRINIGRWSLVGGLVFLTATGLALAGWQIALDPQYAKDDARSVAAYLQAKSTPDDVIVVEANDYTLSYYDHGLAATKMITASTEADAFQQLSQAVGTAQQVWLAHWAVSTQDPRGSWRFLLEQSGRLIDWTSYHGYELYAYEMNSPIAQPVLIDRAPLDFALAKAKAWSAIQDQGEGALAIAIEWQRGDQLSAGARVAVRLLDSAGHEVNSVNMPLIDEAGQPPAAWPIDQPTMNYYVLPIPPGTPPLTYTLDARVYEPKSGPDILSSEQVLGAVQLSRRLDANDPYRTLDGYQWQTISSTAIAPGLNLEAFSVAPQMPKPLDQVDVTLRWRKTGSIDNAAPHVRLIQNDRVWVDLGSNLFERDYPIDQWQIGETVIEHRTLIYPPIAGEAQLQIGQGDRWLPLITTTLNTSALSFAAPTMQHSQSAAYSHFADLLGYDLSADSIALYRPLELTIYWRAMNTEPITASYTVFTQLIAADGHLVAQQDGLPSPIVQAWVKGQIIADRHALKVVDPAYRGPATLIAGWYNSATIERLKMITGDDHVTLQTPITVTDK
jgi:4-amino-4-deoxy-L-arabinose transferase-like glycosyltransferase